MGSVGTRAHVRHYTGGDATPRDPTPGVDEGRLIFTPQNPRLHVCSPDLYSSRPNATGVEAMDPVCTEAMVMEICLEATIEMIIFPCIRD